MAPRLRRADPYQFHSVGPIRIRLQKDALIAFETFVGPLQRKQADGIFKFVAVSLYNLEPETRDPKYEIVLFVHAERHKFTKTKWTNELGPGKYKIVRCPNDKSREATIRECQGLDQDNAKPGQWLRSPRVLRSEEFGNADHLGVRSVWVADPVVINSTDDAPEYMQCPIRKHIMHDPVVTPSGHSYEREAIEKHIQRRRKGK